MVSLRIVPNWPLSPRKQVEDEPEKQRKVSQDTKEAGVNVPPRSNARHNVHTGRRSRLSWTCTYVGSIFSTKQGRTLATSKPNPFP